MFTLLRNLSIIAGIIFLLWGSLLYNNPLSPEHNYALIGKDSNQTYLSLVGINQYRFFSERLIYPIHWSSNGEWLFFVGKGFERWNVVTGEHSQVMDILSASDKTYVHKIPNTSDFIVSLTPVKSEFYDNYLTTILYWVSDDGSKYRYLGGPIKHWYISDDGKWLYYQLINSEIIYRMHPNGEDRQISPDNETSQFGYFEIYITSPLNDQFVSWNSMRHYWTLQNPLTNASQQITPQHIRLQQTGNVDENYTILTWTVDDWLILSHRYYEYIWKKGSQPRLHIYKHEYFRMRSDTSEKKHLQILDNIGYPNIYIPEHSEWVYFVDDNNYRKFNLYRLNTNSLERQHLLIDFSPLIKRNVIEERYHLSGLIFIEEDNWIIYGEKNALGQFQYIRMRVDTSDKQILYTVSNGQSIYQELSPNRANLLVWDNDRIIIIRIKDGQILNDLPFRYVYVSPPIDRPYQSELPFLLSAWCGFMALLLATLPKVLDKRGVPC